MGAFTSRQNADVEEAEQGANNAYKYPPRSGNFFGSHFIMGGERFDTPQPEAYLFGENADLNFLGNRPTAFPYPPPAANEPTKTLKSLVNIRKESVRFVRNNASSDKKRKSVSGDDPEAAAVCYNIEFTFDSDAKCAITIYYFCSEDASPSGITLTPRDGLISETYHYEKGINQYFSQPGHIFNPHLIPEDDLIYNAGKDQYPVAIHCVVEEGNEECRQSHTTICVIDHHPESNTYVLRALKQKIFVDGLCYLLQEIYGIENKAINKSSVDEDLDDHGSECVICMSETRDTLILPCRHLCLCNSCADSLRYQANNCPICRAPFRALLQIRSVQKGVAANTHILHQNTSTGANGEPAACDQHLPPGYVPVSLIEALNGPPQYVGRVKPHDIDLPDAGGVNTHSINTESNVHKHGNTPHKSTSHRSVRSGKKKHSSTSAANAIQTPQSIEMNTLNNAVVEITPTNKLNPSPTLAESLNEVSGNAEKLQIINERVGSGHKNEQNNNKQRDNNMMARHDAEQDSEDEKLSPLLTPQTKMHAEPGKLVAGDCDEYDDASEDIKSVDIAKHAVDEGEEDDEDEDESKSECDCLECENEQMETSKAHKALGGTKSLLSSSLKQHTQLRKQFSDNIAHKRDNIDDIDYYGMKDAARAKSASAGTSAERGTGGSLKNNIGSFKGATNLMKRTLHKKSTSVGNMAGSQNPSGISGGSAYAHNNKPDKTNISSLPDMLDSPINGNSASTRSSSDSYSSSSSTKQLLTAVPTAPATTTTTNTTANIIVDDKTALQNAVNV